DAADLIVRRRVARASRALDVEIRSDVRELHHVAHASELEAVSGKGNDRDRSVLQRHLAPFGRDDDLLELRMDRACGKRAAADETKQDMTSERRPPRSASGTCKHPHRFSPREHETFGAEIPVRRRDGPGRIGLYPFSRLRGTMMMRIGKRPVRTAANTSANRLHPVHRAGYLPAESRLSACPRRKST